jgi:hypothetical protein
MSQMGFYCCWEEGGWVGNGRGDVGRYVQSAMRGAVTKSYKASWAAACVMAINAGEYALRRDEVGVLSMVAEWSWVQRMITILVGGAAQATRAVVASYGSTTTTTPPTKLWYYMAGGGRGGPIVIPHPDDDGAGSANANDNNNAPLPPPKKTMATPRGGRAMGQQRCQMTTGRRQRRAGMRSQGTQRARLVVEERAICVQRRMAWVGS